MKNIKNKLLLLIAICLLVTPTFVYAEEEAQSPVQSPAVSLTPTTSPSPTPTEPQETPEPVAKEDTEAILSDLKVSEGKWDKKFNSATFDYTITVNSDVSGIIITAEKFGNAVVSGDTGTKSLQFGNNTFSVKVTSKDGNNTNTYTIKIVRATDNLNLKSLKIKGQNINEVFAADTYDYTADITYNVESITVQAAADDENATVTVTGSSNLKVGRNTVKVIVKNAAGETAEYRIIVTRGSEEDLNSATEKEDDESNQVVSSSIVIPENTTSKDNNTTPEKENNTLKYVLIVVFCILLLVIAGLGIYFYFATDNSKKRIQKKINKLRKKQEKIEQELTGLLPIIKEENLVVEDEVKIEEPVDLENTIEVEESLDEELENIDFEEPKKQKRVDRNVLEDFDDIFLDE